MSGVDLAKLGGGELRRMRRKLQIIFQDPYGSMNPRMTIEVGPHRADGHSEASATAAQTAATGPWPCSKKSAWRRSTCGRYPHEFSGGQRQRICIARALAVEPEFIVCDESVSALDVSVQAQVLNLLKRLQEKRGLTYIFISHDLSVVKFMADMMAVMQGVDAAAKSAASSSSARPKHIYAHPKEALHAATSSPPRPRTTSKTSATGKPSAKRRWRSGGV